ncbi:hypothetical protein C6495_18895 [Candidatus Poribacteria bacterium]|nr:MAG: hypothetical protein C6495_18895 [Candidatus Poribacteria bacterium]
MQFLKRRDSVPALKWIARAILSILLVSLVFASEPVAQGPVPRHADGQVDVQHFAVVVNALTRPASGITTSLSLINLAEPNERRAVENEVIPLGNVPSDILIRGHLAYIPNVYSDNILIINLQRRAIIGEIPIRAGAQPQSLAVVNENKMYVTCDAAHEVHVVDIPNRNVTKVITGSFNKPTGITLLNGKAYVTNPAWEWDAEARQVLYHDSSVTVIDTTTDTVLKSIPMPTNAGGIVNNGESTVIVKTTGDFRLISGNLVFIDTTTDEVRKTVNLKMTPGSFAISAEKQLFIQGGGQTPGLLIYDVVTEKWIRDKDDALVDFGGGSGMTFAPDGSLYITYPDWTGGGQDEVRVMGTDETLLKTYRVGPGADNVAIAQIISRPEDINDDGFVNIFDLTIVSRYFGETGPDILGDVNADGVVNVLDLVLIANSL